MGGSYHTALDVAGGCSLAPDALPAGRRARRSLDARLAEVHALLRPLFCQFFGPAPGAGCDGGDGGGGGSENGGGGGGCGGGGGGEESDEECGTGGGGVRALRGRERAAGDWVLALSGSDSGEGSGAE